MGRFIPNFFILTSIMFMLVFACSSVAFSQQMDAKLNMAKRSLTSIEAKLNSLQTGDVSQYNRLSKELTKAADLIKQSTSQSHPDYIKSVQQWTALQQRMADTAVQWQSATASNADSQPQRTEQSQASSSQGTNAQSKTTLNPDTILAKYQKQNRPRLSQYPTPSEVTEWGQKILALQTTELQKDVNTLQQPGVNKQNASRVIRWISGDLQSQIQQEVQARLSGFNSIANTASQLSEQIQGIDAAEKMRGYNFAKGENGRRNAQTLQNGLIALANAQAIEQVFPALANPNRLQQIAKVAIAQDKLESMRKQAEQTATELASLPIKTKVKSRVSLKEIEQELWYRGSVLAYISKKGNIYLNSRDVGDVTSNGKIWVGGNDLGSIEADGKIWFRGNHVGTLEENGKVWRNGSQVGLVEANGKVWVGGNSNGEIVPYNNEWKRAAIVYFFQDLFKS